MPARLAGMVVLVATLAPAQAQWLQWGGPNRDFRCEPSPKLADSWPADGPKKLWSRELGDGYSTILVDGDQLFTMYRKDETEFVVCMNAATGATLWQHEYASQFTKEMKEFGPGPHATPLVCGDRIFTVGANALLHCLNKSDGKVLWSRDLKQEFGGDVPGRGYSASPIAYKDSVILPVGGKAKGQGVMAFNQSDGKVAWQGLDYEEITHASPILVQIGGHDQIVFFMGKEVIGVDPRSGTRLWRADHETKYDANISTPVWVGNNRIFCSAAYGSGSRLIEVSDHGDGTFEAKELWFTKKMAVHHGDVVWWGDWVVGSTGDFGPAFVTALNLKTGEAVWRERGFFKANFVAADNKLIVLDEDGNLALATPSADGLKVLSKCQLLKRTAWSAPTLVGTRLYVRDRHTMMALDLS